MKRKRSRRRSSKASSVASVEEPKAVFYHVDQFGAPGKTIRQEIERAIIDDSEKAKMKDDFDAFYEAAKSVLDDLNSGAVGYHDEFMGTMRDLSETWQQYREVVVSTLRCTHFTGFIDYCHNELIKIGGVIQNLLYHPPVTHGYLEFIPKLSEKLALSFSKVILGYKTLFVELLQATSADIKVIDEARTPLRILRGELSDKYQCFFFVDNQNTPTPVMVKLVSYIDRILKKTQHLVTRPDGTDKVEIAATQIDEALIRLQKHVEADMEGASIGETDSVIMGSLSRFLETESVTGRSVARFSEACSDTRSVATRLTVFLDGQSMRSKTRDQERVRAPWFKEPFFSAMDEVRGRLIEYATMQAARYSSEIDMEQQKLRGEDVYGEMDVLKEQIKNTREKIEVSEQRVASTRRRLNALEEEINGIVPAETTESDLIARLHAGIEAVADEEKELQVIDEEQRVRGNAALEHELDILSKLIGKGERVSKHVSSLVKEIATVKRSIRENERDIEEQGIVQDQLALAVADMMDESSWRRARLKKRAARIEWVRHRVDRLTWKNDHMAENEERHKNRILVAINDICKKTEMAEKAKQEEDDMLKQLLKQCDELEKKVIPQLEHDISRRATELKFHRDMGAKQKDQTTSLMRQAMWSRLDEFVSTK